MFDSNQKINSITEQSEYGVGEMTFIGRATPKTLDQTTVLITNYDINDGILATTKQKFYNSNTFKNAMDESGTPTIKASIYIQVNRDAGFRFNTIKGSKLLDMISLKRLFQDGKVLDMAPQLMYLINETAAGANPKPKHLDMWDYAFDGNMIINPIDGLDSRKQKAFAMTFYALIYEIAHKTNPENPSVIYAFDEAAKRDAININIQTLMEEDSFLPHIVLLQKWASGMEMAPEEFSAILNEQESISAEGSAGTEEQYHLDVIRHGFSCRNLSKAVKNSSIFARIKNAQRVREEGADPLLSNAGLRQALELRRTVSSRPPVKYVFTSYLRRTMETAIIAYAPKDIVLQIFPEMDNDTFRDFMIELPSYPEKIIPMPFISEKKAGFGLNIDNYGIGFTKLRAWIADRLPEYLSGDLGSQIFDLGQLQSLDPNMKTNFDFTKFVQTTYPLLATSKDSYYALVAHADVMRTLYKTIKNASIYPLEGEKRPYNTELWPLDITVGVVLGKVAAVKEINYSGPPIQPAANLVIKPATLDMERAEKLGARCGWVRTATAKKTSKGGKRSSCSRSQTRKVRS
jgi:broad specificity phosphatase PhoE